MIGLLIPSSDKMRLIVILQSSWVQILARILTTLTGLLDPLFTSRLNVWYCVVWAVDIAVILV
jgi:hypothetical protein